MTIRKIMYIRIVNKARRRRRKILVLFVTGNPRTGKSTPPPGVGGCPQILMYLSKITGFLKYLSPMAG